MFRCFSLTSPRTARSLAALGGALALLTTMPVQAQQNRPRVGHLAQAVRMDRRYTRVSLDFSLPSGFQLAERPLLRILFANGQHFLMTRTFISQRGPAWKGYRDLNTEDFPPGAYRLRAEIVVLDPQAKRETITSAWSPFVIPKR
jgi:hypothetical protein